MKDNRQDGCNKNFDQSRTTLEIEQWVKNIIARSGPHMPSWDKQKRNSMCYGVVRELPRLIQFYRPHHEYSEHIVAFWHACEKFGILDCGQPTSVIQQLLTFRLNSTQAVEEIAALVLDYASSVNFKRRASDRLYEQKKRRARLEGYLREKLRWYARTLILRVDLSYPKYFPIDIFEVYQDIDALRAIIGMRYGIFEDLIGYVIDIEQGADTKGYHIHAAFLLPGHLHQRDGYLVRQCGEQWKEITRGYGIFHSCNAEKDKFERRGQRGVGMIHRDNQKDFENAVRTVGYLSELDKDDQYLRIRPMGRRSLYTGI